MVIELLGIPGCGKSTFVKKFINQNNAINPLDIFLYNKSRIKQNLNKIYLMIYFIVKKPKEFFSIFKIYKEIRFTNYRKKIKMMLYLFSILGAQNLAKRKFKNNIIILDEGINQVIWGIAYNSKNFSEKIYILQKSLKNYVGDTVIILDTQIDIIINRLKMREKKGGDELKSDLENDNCCIIRAQEILFRIKDKIQEVKPKCKVKLIKGE